MSKYQNIIDKFKKELEMETDMVEYYMNKFKETEKRVIQLKEAIAELENINGLHACKTII